MAQAAPQPSPKEMAIMDCWITNGLFTRVGEWGPFTVKKNWYDGLTGTQRWEKAGNLTPIALNNLVWTAAIWIGGSIATHFARDLDARLFVGTTKLVAFFLMATPSLLFLFKAAEFKYLERLRSREDEVRRR